MFHNNNNNDNTISNDDNNSNNIVTLNEELSHMGVHTCVILILLLNILPFGAQGLEKAEKNE